MKRKYRIKKNFVTLFFIFTIINCVSAQQSQVRWTQKTNFGGSERTHPISFSIGTKGYIGSGGDKNGETMDFWEYNPDTDTWTQKANIGNIARTSAVGFSIGNKGYAGLGSKYPQYNSDFWEYDPKVNIWTKKASYPGTGKVATVGFSIGELGYIGTGSPTFSIGDETKEFWEYNPVNDSWTRKADFGGDVRDRAVGFSIYSKGYIGTGYHNDGTKSISYNDFWEYDPVNNSWTQKADFSGSKRNNAIGFSIGSKGYIGLGYLSLTDFWQYDSESDSWLQIEEFPGEGRLGPTSFSIGNKGYIGMGYSVGDPQATTTFYNDFWEYQDESLSIPNQEYLQKTVKVHPNPATDFINLSLKGIKIIETTIYNTQGKQQFKTSSNSIDISQLYSGIYYLKISTSKGIVTKKIIKN